MKPQNELDPRLMRKLAILDVYPNRNPEKAKTGREAFLQESQTLSEAVPSQPRRPLDEWKRVFQSIFVIRRKGQPRIISALTAILVIVTLLIGGSGITVAAAQNSQPDQALYGVKILSEDVRLGLTNDSLKDSELALEFANRRVTEILALVQKGETPSTDVLNRYQAQVELTIRSAVNLPDDQAVTTLEEIRTDLEIQQKTFLAFQNADSTHSTKVKAVLSQTQKILQQNLQWVDKGMVNPGGLREQMRTNNRQLNQPGVSTPTSDPGCELDADGNCLPPSAPQGESEGCAETDEEGNCLPPPAPESEPEECAETDKDGNCLPPPAPQNKPEECAETDEEGNCLPAPAPQEGEPEECIKDEQGNCLPPSSDPQDGQPYPDDQPPPDGPGPDQPPDQGPGGDPQEPPPGPSGPGNGPGPNH